MMDSASFIAVCHFLLWGKVKLWEVKYSEESLPVYVWRHFSNGLLRKIAQAMDWCTADTCTLYSVRFESVTGALVSSWRVYVSEGVMGIWNLTRELRTFHHWCWPGISQQHDGVNYRLSNPWPGQVWPACATQVAVSQAVGICCCSNFSVPHSGAQGESLLRAFSLGKTLTDCLLIGRGAEPLKKKKKKKKMKKKKKGGKNTILSVLSFAPHQYPVSEIFPDVLLRTGVLIYHCSCVWKNYIMQIIFYKRFLTLLEVR